MKFTKRQQHEVVRWFYTEYCRINSLRTLEKVDSELKCMFEATNLPNILNSYVKHNLQISWYYVKIELKWIHVS